ncbi:unnamed protein product [Owenia fusiformis]|nr:unnamed protein product [Owenia fusiformis]
MWRPLIFLILVGTNAVVGRLGGFSRLPSRSRNGVQSDISSYANRVCRAGDKIPLIGDKCKYRLCQNKVYKTFPCPEGTSFKASFRSCVADGGCLKSYEDKGVADWNTTACGIDLVFVVDMSYSISPDNKIKMKKVIQQLLAQIRIGPEFTMVAGLTYGAETKPFLYISSFNDKKNIREATDKMVMNPRKGTATHLALRETREAMLRTKNGRRQNHKAVVIVMTDGCTNPPEKSDETIAEAQRLKDPESYEAGVSSPEVFLMTFPNEKLDNVKDLAPEEREKLEGIKKREFEAIPSKAENRFDATFDNMKDKLNLILRTSCKEIKTPGQ